VKGETFMLVKNKLYKHHKSKFVLAMRNFSIALSGFLILGGVVAIPTYISDKSVAEAEAKKIDEEIPEELEEANDLKGKDLLNYFEK